MKTKEGGSTYEHSLDHAVEFFSKAGSLFDNKKHKSFYEGEESALSLFQKAWIVDELTSFKLVLWLRDCRGGAGNRSGARSCLRWLADFAPHWIETNIEWIPEVGRWDDLRSLFGTQSEFMAVQLWCSEILNGNVLAAKWADRKDKPLYKNMRLARIVNDIGDFRRLLANARKGHIVEHKMCSKRWSDIKYHTVPSVAMSRYTNAFNKYDKKRFEDFKESLTAGNIKIHADVLFPHDCIRTAVNGDSEIADAQFDALPNYMEDADEKVIVISDTSASMNNTVGGSIQAVDVSQGVALYCSSRLPKESPFYKKFIGFCSESEFKDWRGVKFSDAVRNREIFDRAVGSTRIDTSLNLILDIAKEHNVPQDDMPTTLLIVSDMQFHRGGVKGDGTEVEKALKLWNDAGYETPKIVYWNTTGYAGSATTVVSKNVALVSGFSTSILKSIFNGNSLTPVGVMLSALEKYEVTQP